MAADGHGIRQEQREGKVRVQNFKKSVAIRAKKKMRNDEEGDLEDCDSDCNQYSDGNRYHTGSDLVHEVSGNGTAKNDWRSRLL